MDINKFTKKIISEKLGDEIELINITQLKVMKGPSEIISLGYEIGIKYNKSEIYEDHIYGDVKWSVDDVARDVDKMINKFEEKCSREFNVNEIDEIIKSIKSKYALEINKLKYRGLNKWEVIKIKEGVQGVSNKYKYRNNYKKIYDKCLSDSFALRKIKQILK